MGTRDRIRSFIVETFFAESFGDEDSLLRTGTIDSMGVLELVAFLEKTFGIHLDDDDLVPENLDSVARAAAFVERKTRTAVPA